MANICCQITLDGYITTTAYSDKRQGNFAVLCLGTTVYSHKIYPTLVEDAHRIFLMSASSTNSNMKHTICIQETPVRLGLAMRQCIHLILHLFSTVLTPLFLIIRWQTITQIALQNPFRYSSLRLIILKICEIRRSCYVKPFSL